MSPTILTASGISFDLVEPHTDMVDIHDIAHALSHLCRFTGHTRDLYTVAEHSYHASCVVPRELALEALLHDASEAYIGDVSTPLKQLLPEYRLIEQRIECVIRYRFGLPMRKAGAVKRADMIMLATERRDQMPDIGDDWRQLENVVPLHTSLCVPMSPTAARRAFLDRFQALTGVTA